jgi:hypothetical protein
MEGLRLAFMCDVHESPLEDRDPTINADVQIWRGKDHLVTIEICHGVRWVRPVNETRETVEYFASGAARQLARIVSDTFTDRLELGECTTLADVWAKHAPAKGSKID